MNVQGKLELITGIPASNQILSLLNSQEDTRVIAELNDDSKPLEFYGLRDWQVIKVKTKKFINVHSLYLLNYNCNKGGR